VGESVAIQGLQILQKDLGGEKINGRTLTKHPTAGTVDQTVEIKGVGGAALPPFIEGGWRIARRSD